MCLTVYCVESQYLIKLQLIQIQSSLQHRVYRHSAVYENMRGAEYARDELVNVKQTFLCHEGAEGSNLH